jgi:radical SAM protein with 4Fe4S-binding SPASM domain
METFVNWNGDVFPCGCVVTESKDSMGNVFESSFEDVWNEKKIFCRAKGAFRET